MQISELAAGVAGRNRRACARLITLVEEGDPAALEQLPLLPVGNAYRIGITGPPGAGKSTLINRLIKVARQHQETVGVLAIDPSSPFSGGAVLGDRVRMQSHAFDPGVFIRSMGNRGNAGGLAASTADACRVLAAWGCTVIFIETLGVGQAEVAVAEVAELTVLVLGPHAGDGVQALKAGILEIPDLFVINKADLPGAALAASDLALALDLDQQRLFLTRAWEEGTTDDEIERLWEALVTRRASRATRLPPAVLSVQEEAEP